MSNRTQREKWAAVMVMIQNKWKHAPEEWILQSMNTCITPNSSGRATRNAIHICCWQKKKKVCPSKNNIMNVQHVCILPDRTACRCCFVLCFLFSFFSLFICVPSAFYEIFIYEVYLSTKAIECSSKWVRTLRWASLPRFLRCDGGVRHRNMHI